LAMSSEEFGQFVKREVVASEAIVRTRRIVLD